MLMGASNSRRLGWVRKSFLAVRQSCLISESLSRILFPLLFLPSNNLSIMPSNNPSIINAMEYCHSTAWPAAIYRTFYLCLLAFFLLYDLGFIREVRTLKKKKKKKNKKQILVLGWEREKQRKWELARESRVFEIKLGFGWGRIEWLQKLLVSCFDFVSCFYGCEVGQV